ncbi:uncharacterized protein LOC122034349 [Zingiber officinale]|uniref:Uncharacterized protein n=1 Tax=Zingiber officinale TaxID=94328 RepID=A0A8J5LSW4_ZINOF|nr:uncharacterized protein LOC122034349 [Zingiber officinale]KAG6537449.1 hypothetical protein ZIOFF_002543 [Zingiber officinale]
MPTVAALLPQATFFSRPRPLPLSITSLYDLHVAHLLSPFGRSKTRLPLVLACSAVPFNEFDAKVRSKIHSSKKSSLLSLVDEIEPLDLRRIQKDVPPNTVSAMKRTISSMLGLLPSNQFNVTVEVLWESLFKLLISSIKTGYTLCNAEYRLCLEKNIDIPEKNIDHDEKGKTDTSGIENTDIFSERTNAMFNSLEEKDVLNDHNKHNMHEHDESCEDMSTKICGNLTPQAIEYIQQLQSKLRSVEKDLYAMKRKHSALQMQQFVGDEKNELLDYLRSLQPEKVAEISEPTCSEVDDVIHSVGHGLLAALSPKMYFRPPQQSENMTAGILNAWNDDSSEHVDNTYLKFQPMVTVPRDFLARLLFWCMLLGHYIRGLEFRLGLVQLFNISDN